MRRGIRGLRADSGGGPAAWRRLRVVLVVCGCLVLGVAASAARAQAATLYVSAAASADPTCAAASQKNPFATIAGALNCLKSGTVKVGAGTFAGGFTITKNATLTGAGASTVIANPGEPQLSLSEVTIADGHNVTLNDLTINGEGAQGDIAMGSGSLRVTNSTLTGGLANNRGPAIDESPGSGQASVTLLRSTLNNNHGLGRRLGRHLRQRLQQPTAAQRPQRHRQHDR